MANQYRIVATFLDREPVEMMAGRSEAVANKTLDRLKTSIELRMFPKPMEITVYRNEQVIRVISPGM